MASTDRWTDRQTDSQLICEEDTFRWLWRGDLREEIESEITQHKIRHYKQNIRQQIYNRQTQISNADCVINMTRQ